MIHVYYISPGSKELNISSYHTNMLTYVIRFTGGKLMLSTNIVPIWNVFWFSIEKNPCGKVTHAAIVNTVDI